MNREEKLKSVYSNWHRDTSKITEALKAGRKSTGLWGQEEGKALYSLFIREDVIGAKHHFYQCGLIDEFEITYLDSSILDYGINHLGYALLSDDTHLIRRYSTLQHSQFKKMVERGASTPLYILQCIIREDWLEFERAMEIMKTCTLKKFPMALDMAFYRAIADKNTADAEAILHELVSPKIHKQRNKHHALVNEFVSHPAIGYAKLAWLKGMEVNVSTPLIPAQLLPIAPLANYTNDHEDLFDSFISGKASQSIVSRQDSPTRVKN